MRLAFGQERINEGFDKVLQQLYFLKLLQEFLNRKILKSREFLFNDSNELRENAKNEILNYLNKKSNLMLI